MHTKIERRSSQVLVNVLKPYFIKKIEFQNLSHILKPLLGPMLHIGKKNLIKVKFHAKKKKLEGYLPLCPW
jgi:hypothetical protein